MKYLVFEHDKDGLVRRAHVCNSMDEAWQKLREALAEKRAAQVTINPEREVKPEGRSSTG